MHVKIALSVIHNWMYLFQSCFICKYKILIKMFHVKRSHFWGKCFLLASLSKSGFTFSLGSSFG